MKEYFNLLNSYPITSDDNSDTVVEKFALLVKSLHLKTAIDGSLYSPITDVNEKADYAEIYINVVNTIEPAITNYVNSRIAWKNNKNDANLKKKILDNFDFLEDLLRKTLVNNGILRTKGQYAFTLQLFALYSTLIILLLRDCILNGKSWGLSNGEYNEFKKFYSICILDYAKHAKTTYSEYVVYVKSQSLSGKDKFDKINRFRNVCAVKVFDLIDSWYSLDNDKFVKRFSLKENLRYLWSNICGMPVDTTKAVSVYKDGDLKDTYYTPSCASIEELFVNEKHDQYKILSSIKINHDSSWVYSVQSIYKDPSNGSLVEGDRKGVQAINTSLTKDYPYDKSKESSYGYGSYDITPLSLRLLPSTTFNLTRSISYKNKNGTVVNNNTNITEFVDRPVNHIIGKVVGNVINKQINSKGNVLDCMFVGSISNDVDELNIIYKERSTIINAQKFSKTTAASATADVEFQKDHVLPTVHAMFLPGGSSITFKFINNSILDDKIHSFAIRYHFSGSADKATFDLIDSTRNTVIKSGLVLEKCSKENNFNEYKVKVFPGATIKVPYTTSITIKSNNHLYINSIILIPN